MFQYEGHEASITSMQFLNQRVLCSSSMDGTVRLWDTTSGACETVIKFGRPINQMRVHGINIEVLYNTNTIAEVNSSVTNCFIHSDSEVIDHGSVSQFLDYFVSDP